MEPLFVIGLGGVEFKGGKNHPEYKYRMEFLRKEWKQNRCLRFSKVMEEKLLEQIQRENDEADFQDISNEDIGRELGTLNQETIRRMNALVNNRELFDFLKEVTGVEEIGCFTGRIIKMVPGFDLDWHTDFYGHSIIGMSLNLGRERFEGGEFQIRIAGTKDIHCRVHNEGIGDALFFSLGENLEHRVTPVQGRAERISFAGWFRRFPRYEHEDYLPLLQECLED